VGPGRFDAAGGRDVLRVDQVDRAAVENIAHRALERGEQERARSSARGPE
jgi:hypothetical protein